MYIRYVLILTFTTKEFHTQSTFTFTNQGLPHPSDSPNASPLSGSATHMHNANASCAPTGLPKRRPPRL